MSEYTRAQAEKASNRLRLLFEREHPDVVESMTGQGIDISAVVGSWCLGLLMRGKLTEFPLVYLFRERPLATFVRDLLAHKQGQRVVIRIAIIEDCGTSSLSYCEPPKRKYLGLENTNQLFLVQEMKWVDLEPLEGHSFSSEVVEMVLGVP